MAMKYVLVERGKPGDTAAPKKWYASAKSSGELKLRDLSNRIADISTVSQIDTMAVLEALLQVIPDELADGNIVRLGELGSFYTTIKSGGSDDPDSFTASLIEKTSIKFRPGKLVNNTLKTIEYKKV